MKLTSLANLNLKTFQNKLEWRCLLCNTLSSSEDIKYQIKSTMLNERDTKQSVLTDKPVALRFRIELEFENAGF